MIVVRDDADQLRWDAILWQELCFRVGALHVDVCVSSVASVLRASNELQDHVPSDERLVHELRHRQSVVLVVRFNEHRDLVREFCARPRQVWARLGLLV